MTALLGFPPTWGAFATGLNSWKEAPTFEELWTACSQEELEISLVAILKEYQMPALLNIKERNRKQYY